MVAEVTPVSAGVEPPDPFHSSDAGHKDSVSTTTVCVGKRSRHQAFALSEKCALFGACDPASGRGLQLCSLRASFRKGRDAQERGRASF